MHAAACYYVTTENGSSSVPRRRRDVCRYISYDVIHPTPTVASPLLDFTPFRDRNYVAQEQVTALISYRVSRNGRNLTMEILPANICETIFESHESSSCFQHSKRGISEYSGTFDKFLFLKSILIIS